MRGFLLATAGTLAIGIGLSGPAFAQATTGPTPVVPGTTSPAGPGAMTAPAAPVTPPPPAAMPPNATYGTGGLGQPPNAALYSGSMSPGSFAVHLNGRVNWYAGVAGSSVDNVDGNKLNNQEFQGYLRLYPGFDAVAANGLQYGVVGEIRNPGSNFTGVGATAGSNASANTLYWNRAYGYMGLPNIGTVNFGETDAAFDLFQVGTFEGFNDGAWNGDVPGFIPGNAVAVYPFADVGNIQSANRITYLSPVWDGFQFGGGFSPTPNALINSEGCSVASATCNRLASTDSPSVVGRYRNMVDVAATYNNSFGAFGVSAYGGGLWSGKVNNTSGLPGTQSVGFAVGAFGLTVSYAGFTVGGHFNFGQENGDFNLKPQGGVPGLAFMLGGQYATGPVIVGASYFKYKFQGDFTSPTTEGVETDNGIAAGGTYAVAPGLALYLSYLYGWRHQGGFDFNTGLANAVEGTPFGTNNNVQSQVIAVGTVVKW
jgi:predicted porin